MYKLNKQLTLYERQKAMIMEVNLIKLFVYLLIFVNILYFAGSTYATILIFKYNYISVNTVIVNKL